MDQEVRQCSSNWGEALLNDIFRLCLRIGNQLLLRSWGGAEKCSTRDFVKIGGKIDRRHLAAYVGGDSG